MDQHGKVRSDGNVLETADTHSWGEIVSAVIQNIQNIFRAEMRLAGVEIREKVRKSAKAGGLLGAAALLGLLAAACVTTACIAALAIVLPVWLAALIMAVLLGGGAGGAFLLGRLALEDVDPIPQQTMETIKDNIEWAKTRAQ